MERKENVEKIKDKCEWMDKAKPLKKNKKKKINKNNTHTL